MIQTKFPNFFAKRLQMDIIHYMDIIFSVQSTGKCCAVIGKYFFEDHRCSNSPMRVIRSVMASWTEPPNTPECRSLSEHSTYWTNALQWGINPWSNFHMGEARPKKKKNVLTHVEIWRKNSELSNKPQSTLTEGISSLPLKRSSRFLSGHR